MINSSHIKPGVLLVVPPGIGVTFLCDHLAGPKCINITPQAFAGSAITHVDEKHYSILLIENMNLKIDAYMSIFNNQKTDMMLMNKDVWKVLIEEEMFLAGFDENDWNGSSKL